MSTRLEHIILRHLIYHDEYTRKVLPFLADKYFHIKSEKLVFTEIAKFIQRFNACPTQEALSIAISESRDLREDDVRECLEVLKLCQEQQNEPVNIEWLLAETESFCRDKAIYNAVLESVDILEDKKNKKSKNSIPDLLKTALGVSFNPHIGHDYLEQPEDRYEFYHRPETRVPFDLRYFNLITNGGLPTKTLNIVMAATGAGKSLFMCHCAAAAMVQGKNVLYITLEMAEERIAERIDANVLDLDLHTLRRISKEDFLRKFDAKRQAMFGKLIIKEYPTAAATTLHFHALLNELRLKQNFVPDILFVDYLNICASARVKHGNNINSYSYIKAIAEELRGLAVEFNIPVVSATQVNRTGFASSDPEMTDASESMGLPHTADFLFALITNKELDDLGQMMVKQLKNRYGDPINNRRFVIGVDRSKMRLFDVNDVAQTPNGPVRTNASNTMKPTLPTTENRFKGLLV